MPLYNVMTTAYNKGLIQLIPNTQTLEEMPIKETSGFKNLFGKKSLNKYLILTSGISPEEAYENFINTNVAYSVANFVIGITQRTKKNIHFKKNGEVYYTSFDHILNHYSKNLGDRGVPFIINVTFMDFLKKNNKLKEYIETFLNAFLSLRNKSNDLIKLMELLLSSGLPEISHKSLTYMEDSLSLNKSEKEAKEIMGKVLERIMDKN